MTSLAAIPTVVALLLAAAVLAASLRLLLQVRAGRITPGRCAGILGLQAVAAVLLFLVVYPPATSREAGVLTVLAEGAAGGRPAGQSVALPEYRGRGVDTVPDLATALRHHPGTTRIVVQGTGLPWRDHDAANGIDVAFDPTPLPSGLAELHLPQYVVAGRRVVVHGRVAGVDGARLELRDPADRPIAGVAADDQGRFALPLVARAPGTVEFVLRVLDATGERIDESIVALSVGEGRATRVLLLAGAPSAELRALRRWAVDAGVALESRIQLSRDASLGNRPYVEADELAALDLLILDERTWRALDGPQRLAIREAIRNGLGVLLRVGDVLDDEDRESLQVLGFQARNIELDDPGVRLAPEALDLIRSADADVDGGRDAGATPLARRPLAVEAADGIALLRSDTDEPLALWRGEGLGRVALWWLQDTHPLVRLGEPGTHAGLWSTVVSTLARADTHRTPALGIDAGPHARRVLCGLGNDAGVRAPDGRRVELLADDRGCAAYWPEEGGWHVLLDNASFPFHVAPSSTLHVHAMHAATRALASRPHPATSTVRSPAPGSPWPWFVAFLATVAGLWALERRRPSSGRPD